MGDRTLIETEVLHQLEEGARQLRLRVEFLENERGRLARAIARAGVGDAVRTCLAEEEVTS